MGGNSCGPGPGPVGSLVLAVGLFASGALQTYAEPSVGSLLWLLAGLVYAGLVIACWPKRPA